MLFTGGVSLRTALKKETSRSTLIKFWRHVTQRGEEAVRTDTHLEEEVLKNRQKYHKTFVHKIHGRKDFMFYCSSPKINQEFGVKGHGSKKRTNLLLLKTGLAKENGCTDSPWLMQYLHHVRYWTIRILRKMELHIHCILSAYTRGHSWNQNSNTLHPDRTQHATPPPVLSPSSILPPFSSNCAFARARKNLGRVLFIYFIFYYFFYFSKLYTWNCVTINWKSGSIFFVKYNVSSVTDTIFEHLHGTNLWN